VAQYFRSRCLPVRLLLRSRFPLTDHSLAADTIRILVATDSHVGYGERDPIRKDDSWKSFDEVMELARTQDVCASSHMLQ
jgi:hypothetical protein